MCIYVCGYVCMCVYMYMYICIYIYITLIPTVSQYPQPKKLILLTIIHPRSHFHHPPSPPTSDRFQLVDNYRNDPLILSISSHLFYPMTPLVAAAGSPVAVPGMGPVIQYIGVNGQQEYDKDSPSLRNVEEAVCIVRYA